MPTRRSRPAVAVRLLWALLTRLISMLGPHHLYVLTSLFTTQTRALAASSLMLRRARLDSRPVHRVRAMSKSRPRMALSEFVARSAANPRRPGTHAIRALRDLCLGIVSGRLA